MKAGCEPFEKRSFFLRVEVASPHFFSFEDPFFKEAGHDSHDCGIGATASEFAYNIGHSEPRFTLGKEMKDGCFEFAKGSFFTHALKLLHM